MKSNKGKMFFLLGIIIIVIAGAIYKNYEVSAEKRLTMDTVNNIEVYYFTTFNKFSKDKIEDEDITDEKKLETFKNVFNSLDSSSDVKRIKEDLQLKTKDYDYYYHIKPQFTYEEKGEEKDGEFLLYLLVEKNADRCYLLFSNTELAYIIEGDSAKAMNSVFVDVDGSVK